MNVEKFKQLIYVKGFNTVLTQRLLKIADSSMVMEDLLELIEEKEEGVFVEEPDSSDCDDCDYINTAESERDDAQDGRDEAEKKFKDLKRNLSDLIVKFDGQAHRIISGVMPKKKIEPTGKTGDLGITVPTLRTHILQALSLTLCTACKAVDRNNPPCKTCDRPICPECEADNTDDPPCSTCERNRPHA
jgi:hypothetical protein